uniref:dTDP-glucose 4,6-dehydratase n=1 Tax=uncultured bacterium CSL1 TaxID=1091565 RepID=G4WV95_9BACT|nr:dTDP-glucose 4,6-dehydratase [uncultured bacterium CSL1]
MTLSPQSLLVTGGAGFIGSCFVGQCVQQGLRVIVLDALTYAGHRENLAWIPASASGGSFELVEGDISDGALVSRLLREHAIEAVVNFAAESHVDNSISGPAAFIDTNIVGAYHLLEACRAYWNQLAPAPKAAFRFVQISTDEVYGSLGETGKFSEESPIQPNSPYSASKAAADLLARAWFHTYGFPTIVTHCTNNYGPRQYPEKVIPVMITCALAGKNLPVYGTGSNVRDWIHVEDHCAGVMLALTKGKPGEAYDLGGDSEVRNIELVKQICTILDALRPRADGQSYATQIHFVTDRLGHDQRYAIDDAKAQNELGFVRKHRFEPALKETVAWYLANEQWCATVRKKP